MAVMTLDYTASFEGQNPPYHRIDYIRISDNIRPARYMTTENNTHWTVRGGMKGRGAYPSLSSPSLSLNLFPSFSFSLSLSLSLSLALSVAHTHTHTLSLSLSLSLSPSLSPPHDFAKLFVRAELAQTWLE